MALKGYYIQSGYKGWTGTKWQLFATEKDYWEYMEAQNENI